MDSNTHYAILSGSCAAAASLFGKLSGLPSIEDHPLLRILFFILMLICNANVWTLYVKALQSASSSLVATVTSTATNYILSAIIGILIFKEVTSLLWWTGIGFIISGLLLVLKDQIKKEDTVLQKAKLN